MKELVEAANKMNKVLRECEDDCSNADQTLNELSKIKVHGVVFPTLMLLEIMNKFAEGAEERAKAKFDTTNQEQEIQNRYADIANKWNKLN
tara:strand:+ start:22232 stop:22504 length:273 start_codon:yes stop_codon:yes gene_type:complete